MRIAGHQEKGTRQPTNFLADCQLLRAKLLFCERRLGARPAYLRTNVCQTFSKRIEFPDNPSAINDSSVLAERGPFFVKLRRSRGVRAASRSPEPCRRILSRFAGVSEAGPSGSPSAPADGVRVRRRNPAPACRGSGAEGSSIEPFARPRPEKYLPWNPPETPRKFQSAPGWRGIRTARTRVRSAVS